MGKGKRKNGRTKDGKGGKKQDAVEDSLEEEKCDELVVGVQEDKKKNNQLLRSITMINSTEKSKAMRA